MGRGASTNSIPEIDDDRFLLVIGSNTTEAHPVLALRMKRAVRDGATLVVADPRKIWLTKIAKRHLQLRPGTDVWLLNALMHVILEEGLQDEEYIRAHTVDFDSVREVVSRYTPEDAERVTGVPAEDIRATAREYAAEKHAAVFYTLGITEHACAVDNVWSLSNLVLMTGHLGYESTGLNALRGQNNVQGLNDAGREPFVFPRLPVPDRPGHPREVRGALGRRDAGDARLPARPDDVRPHDGRIKALYLVGENPAQTEPNARHVEEGLAHLEFMVAQDLFLNESTRDHANVVFPASSFAEKDGTFTNTERRVNRVRKALDSPGNAREDWRIVVAFANALGAGWEYESAEQAGTSSPTCRPTGRASATTESRSRGSSGRVPTGTIRAPASSTPPIPRGGRQGQVLPGRVPAADRAAGLGVPLRPLHRPHALPLQLGEDDHAGAGHDRQAAGDPFFEISAEDASSLGLADGDPARLVSRRGALEARRADRDRVYPGLVWMALHFAQAKVNWLTHDVGDSADRDAGVQGLGRAHRACLTRSAVHPRGGVRVHAAPDRA